MEPDTEPPATSDAVAALYAVEREIAKVIVGQRTLIRRLLIGLLCDGHLLLEGVPGLAKTTAIACLAQAVQASFHRIQFTPDLLPADIIGTRIFEDGHFRTHRGPVFAQLLLADEINRAPAKVQSALLEAMQERQVTIGDESIPLPRPFLVLATQNPLEHEGTYPLPEAQTDRFLMKIRVDYPAGDEERAILDRALAPSPAIITPVLDTPALEAARLAAHAVHLDGRLRDYCVAVVRATRDPAACGLDLAPFIETGASVRATIALAQCARAEALLAGRDFVTPHDIKAVAGDVLRHRLILSYEAEAEGLDIDSLLARLLDHVPVP